jgi:predicted RNase H-like HicB family nuclease
MEGKIVAHSYNLSLIFYPQPEGGYTVVCPEIAGCFTEGETIEEAEENIREVIADFLPDEINKGKIDEEMFRLGCCGPGKLFREIEVEATDAGEVVFPLAAKIKHAVPA